MFRRIGSIHGMYGAVGIVISIHTNLFFWAAMMVLILPLAWILAAISAALFHELCHIVLVYCLNGKILKMNVQSDGCILETTRMKEWKQFICILAGPLGSMSLLILYRTAPKVAICGFIHGLYNLIPILPSDGGRLLHLILYQFCPKRTDDIMRYVAIVISFAITAYAIWYYLTVTRTGLPLFLAVSLLIKSLPRKTPCKQS